MYDVLIVGCGITGAAAAYELSKYQLRIAVLEKENDISDGTTKANSAILHAGYDPKPGTLMARLNVEGSRLAKELCRDLDVPYRQTGSMVLAFSKEECAVLEELLDRGKKNGVPDLALLTGEEARQQEPLLSEEVQAALYAPTAAIVSPWEYALALTETALRNGAELFRETRVTGMQARPEGGYLVRTTRGDYEARYVINAAGVHGDEIHNMAAPPSFQILPNRGQYYLLDKSEGSRASHVLFQCPTKAGKGVLVSPTVHGNLIVGPNAEDVGEKEDAATTAAGLSFVAEKAAKTIPTVNFRESIRNFAGVRAHAVDTATGDSITDFIISEAAPGFLDLAGIQSPGLTAAPAIAVYAAELLKKAGLSLQKKENFLHIRKRVRFKELSSADKNRLIQQDPRYGRIICRCETITEGEIVDALHSPVPPRTIDGVKRRTGAGMGRCQGGFCGPRVLEIIARELSIDPKEVLQDKEGTVIITGETKNGKEALQ